MQRPEDINDLGLFMAEEEARVAIGSILQSIHSLLDFYVFFSYHQILFFRKRKNLYNVGSEMRFLGGIILHDMLLKNSSMKATIQENGTR